MMFVMTAFSTIFSFVTLVHQDELVPFFQFVSSHPEIHLHFVAFGVCSTIGQLLIFHTIRSFGAVVFAIIMTVRTVESSPLRRPFSSQVIFAPLEIYS